MLPAFIFLGVCLIGCLAAGMNQVEAARPAFKLASKPAFKPAFKPESIPKKDVDRERVVLYMQEIEQLLSDAGDKLSGKGYEGAERELRRVLELLSLVPKVPVHLQAFVRENLSVCCWMQGRRKEGLEFLTDAVRVASRTNGPDDALTGYLTLKLGRFTLDFGTVDDGC